MPPLGFLLVATSLVGLFHFYIGIRLLPDLPGPMSLHVVAWALLAFSALLQPLGLMMRRLRNQLLRDLLGWVAMMAMGFFSFLLVFTVLRDLGLLVATGFQMLAMLPVSFDVLREQSAVAVCVIALLLSAVGFLNARRLARVKRVEVPLRNLPASLHGFRIVQISDIHVGPTIKHAYLSRIVERVNSLEADLVAITGDLVDGRVTDLAEHTAPLQGLRSRYGSYFVTGNHEYYSGAKEWITELRRLGVRVLMNEHVQITHDSASLVLAGVTDYNAGAFYPEQRSDALAAIAGAPTDVPRVLLAHQPRSADAAAKAGFDLQISGHTHGGQFWPWNHFVPLQQPFTAGLHRFRDMWVYISRGTGYWGPPTRFGAPSEISLLILITP